jgi:hypothetical protein
MGALLHNFINYLLRQEVSMLYKESFKILTLLLSIQILLPTNLLAALISQKQLKTHYRIELNVNKSQLKHSKEGDKLVLQTLDLDLYNQVVGELAKLKAPKDYINKIDYSIDGYPAKPARIEITLGTKDIELFNFYEASTKKLIFDFWKDNKGATLQERISQVDAKKKAPKLKKVAKKVVAKVSKLPKAAPINNIIKIKQKKAPKKVVSPYRDFRYGAALVWNYDALIPALDKDVNLKVKSPDFLYKVQDREFTNDPKEEHMQLSVNFYRKKDWGLLKRSVDLYKKKYGSDSNKALNEFMLVVALMQDNIAEKNAGINSAAMNMLMNVIAATDDYDLKTSSLRFIIQDAIDSKDYLKALKYGKKLYLTAASQFDNDLTIKSSEVILHSLARLKQYAKIDEFLKEKAVIRVLPKQMGYSYKYFVLLSKDKEEDVVKSFEKKSKKWAGLLEPAIIFNVAESYFREGQYKKAVKLFDQFVVNYSHITKGLSASRVRIGLIYDLLEENPEKVIDLYTVAVDRTTSPKHRFEAKLRLAAMKLTRKKVLTKKDKRYEVLLEKTAQEKVAVDANLNKLLWMVRLRTMINQQKFEEALTYLESVPYETLTESEKRAFNLDGAEIVKGLVSGLYDQKKYARATRIWELYKMKYTPKVAKSLYTNFLIADAFSQLGLTKSFNRAKKQLTKIKRHEIRNFPLWTKDRKKYSQKEFITELSLMNAVRSEDWGEVKKVLKAAGNSFPNRDFYYGLVATNEKRNKDAVKSFETVLIDNQAKSALTPEQMQQLISNYVEILFKQDEAKFLKTAKAIIKDLESMKLNTWNKVVERIEYLYMEGLSSGNKRRNAEIIKMSASFLQKFKKSSWEDRVQLIRAKALVKTKKVTEASKILKSLISKDEASAYIKELARSELTMIELNNNSLQ